MSNHVCHNDERIRKLENDSIVMGSEIKNLIKSLDDLTSWIKGLVLVLTPIVFGCFGWLVIQVFKK